MAKKKPKAARPILRRRPQVAALPLKMTEAGLRVLLVTSRETKRWVIPKGWPMKGLKNCDAAAVEAREEAGLIGTIARKPMGSYNYFKRRDNRFEPCKVRVYRLEVTDQQIDWSEKGQRKLAWFSPEDAADLVEEQELADLIRSLVPRPPPDPDMEAVGTPEPDA